MPTNGANGTDVGRYIVRVMTSLEPIETFARYFYSVLLVFIALFAFALGIQAYAADNGGFKVFLLAFGTSLVVSAAATAVGCLLGFLFGIPRSLQGSAPVRSSEPRPSAAGSPDQPRTAASVARAFMSNTSLEEISDWLTKIIIGLGLVQFQLLIEYLYRCSLYSAAFVAAQSISVENLPKQDYDPQLASPFFFALIVTTLIAGCMFAYLETRTRLMLLFVDAEGANLNPDRELAERAGERPVSVSQPTEALTDSKGGRPASPIAVAPTAEDVTVTKVPLETLKNLKEVLGWASAQARTGNFVEAERGLLDALQKSPEDDSIRERIVEVRRLNKDDLGALKMSVEIANRTSDARKRYDLLRSALYEALYIEPGGFNQALEISQKLLEMPEGKASATISLWRAAALGQKYKSLEDGGALREQDDMKAIWNEALSLLTKVVEISPSYDGSERELMRSLYEGRLGGENDLAVFKSAEFDAVVYRGKPQ